MVEIVFGSHQTSHVESTPSTMIFHSLPPAEPGIRAPRSSKAPPPTDIVPSALFIPLSKVTSQHLGRKLRLVVQILAYNSITAHLVVATNSPGRPTLVADLRVLLKGASPATYHERQWWESEYPSSARAVDGSKVPRQRLHLAPGEWVTLVGWLAPSSQNRYVNVLPGYSSPPPAMLECIHVSMSRPPPVGAVCFGETEPWDHYIPQSPEG